MDQANFNSFLQQMAGPAMWETVIGLSILAAGLEWWPAFNSRMIVPLLIGLGPLTYWLFVPAGSIPSFFPHPWAVKVVNGLVAGLIAGTAHKQVICRILGGAEPTKSEGRNPKAEGNPTPSRSGQPEGENNKETK